MTLLYNGQTCEELKPPFWHSRPMVASVVPLWPYSYNDHRCQNSNKSLCGSDADLVAIFSKHFNIKVKLKFEPNYEDGIAAVELGHSDIFISQSSHNLARCSKVHCGVPTNQFIFKFVVAKAKPRDKNATFTYPFSTKLWLALVIAAVATTLTLTMLDSERLWQRALSVTFLNLLQVGVSPSHYKVPLSQLVLLTLWMLSALVLSHAYKSNLLAMLVIEDYEKDVNTLNDFLARDMKIMVPTKTIPHKIVTSAHQDSLLGKVYRELVVKKDGEFEYSGIVYQI